jgi:hypothetical protein
MNCKCGELKLWLGKEIAHLEEMKNNMTRGSNLHDVVDAKIFAYSIVLDGLNG